jgi:hypothetical protein
MAIVTNIAFWVLLIPAAVTSCFLAKRYKELRNYTFWVEQSLLQHRPETYIPPWRRRQRDKDICRKDRRGKYQVQTSVKSTAESRLEIPSLG